MVLHCAIHLSRDPPVYSPGDMVDGVLVLSSTWADKIHGISVKLVKKLEVEWDTYRLYEQSRVSSVEDVTFLGECQILNVPAPSPSTSCTSPSSCIATASTSKQNAAVLPLPSCSSSSPVASCSYSSPVASCSYSSPVASCSYSSPVASCSYSSPVASCSYSSPVASCSYSSPVASCSSSSGTGPLAKFTSKKGVVVTRSVQHRYPFLLKIAYELDLPASFSGTYGYIAYKLVAFIKSPKKGIIIGTLKDIIIYPILDLNHLDHSLQKSVHEKRVFKSLFGYNYVFMKCQLDKRAFLPEELLSFTVEITNKSPATLEGVEVHLNMATQFSIYGASKIENLTLLRIRGPCIGQGEHAIWSHSFNFPSCSYPTGFGQLSRLRSKSIDLQYSILFTLEVSKAEKFAIPFPIVIGTVPFGGSQNHNSTKVFCINHLQHTDALAAAASLAGGSSDGARRSRGNNATPSSSVSTPAPGHQCPPPVPSHSRQNSSQSTDAISSSSSKRQTPGEPDLPPVAACSGGFCCAVRGHHPRCRPRSKSTSALPPTYSATNLYYQCVMLRRAETPPPTYHEANKMMDRQSSAATP